MATRRSPRSIARLCNGMIWEGLNTSQIALLLSLSQCTGWSADRIGLKMFDITQKQLKAEDIWGFHWRWTIEREKKTNQDKLLEEEIELMIFILKSVGVQLKKLGEPLNRTVQPVTVEFIRKWSPKHDNEGLPLCKGFTVLTRDQSKAWLNMQKNSAYGLLSPLEEPVIDQFGSSVKLILIDILKRWARAMRQKLRREPGLRPIKEREYVDLIMGYLREFQSAYEGVFGSIEDSKPTTFGEGKNSKVYIRSTGYGVKVLLGLLMADRLHVVERKRREERERISFIKLEASSLPEDSKVCPICQDEMGIKNPEGTVEDPLRLVVCCDQHIGESCLKAWLGEQLPGYDQPRDTCPVCRFTYPSSFIEKLFEGDNESENEDDGEDPILAEESTMIDLTSPSPEYETSRRRVAPEDLERAMFMAPLQHRVQGQGAVTSIVMGLGSSEIARNVIVPVRDDDFVMEG